MTDEQKLALLRVQLFTAAQTLKGDALKDFWKLIDDIVSIRPTLDNDDSIGGES